MAQSDDPDGAAIGVDALGRGPAAPLGRLLYALANQPIPSFDEAAELDEASPSGTFESDGAFAADAPPRTPGVHDREGGGGGSAAIERLLGWDGAPHARRQRYAGEFDRVRRSSCALSLRQTWIECKPSAAP